MLFKKNGKSWIFPKGLVYDFGKKLEIFKLFAFEKRNKSRNIFYSLDCFSGNKDRDRGYWLFR